MAKKRSKSKSKSSASGNPRSYSQLYKGDNVVENQNAPAPVAEAEQPAQPVQSQQEWGEEYGYVVRDLRSLGIVSVVVIGLMIGIGLLI